MPQAEIKVSVELHLNLKICPEKKSASKFLWVIGRIHVLMVVGPWFPLSC